MSSAFLLAVVSSFISDISCFIDSKVLYKYPEIFSLLCCWLLVKSMISLSLPVSVQWCRLHPPQFFPASLASNIVIRMQLRILDYYKEHFDAKVLHID